MPDRVADGSADAGDAHLAGAEHPKRHLRVGIVEQFDADEFPVNNDRVECLICGRFVRSLAAATSASSWMGLSGVDLDLDGQAQASSARRHR